MPTDKKNKPEVINLTKSPVAKKKKQNAPPRVSNNTFRDVSMALIRRSKRYQRLLEKKYLLKDLPLLADQLFSMTNGLHVKDRDIIMREMIREKTSDPDASTILHAYYRAYKKRTGF